MPLKIKAKRIDQKLFYGAIDESGNVKIEFEYSSIKNYTNFFLCKRYDGTWDLYHVYCGGYKEIITKVLNQDNNYEILEQIGEKEFIAKKNGKIGIINIECRNGLAKISIAYKFGKANEIINENGEIKLIKHRKNKDDLIGFYNDRIYGTLDPDYISIEKKVHSMKCLPKLPKNDNFRNNLSEYANDIYYLKVAKNKNKNTVFGIKQINLKDGKFILEDFLPCEYTMIKPMGNQIIRLEKDLNGKKQTGFLCCSLEWVMSYHYGWAGYPHFKSTITKECIYDDIDVFNTLSTYNAAYIKLIKDGKESLMYVSFLPIIGDFKENGNKTWAHPIIKILENEKFYDSIEEIDDDLFFGKTETESDILVNHRYNYGNIMTIPGNYISLKPTEIKKIKNHAYIAVNKDEQKQFIFFESTVKDHVVAVKSDFYKNIEYFGDYDRIGLIVGNEDGKNDAYKPFKFSAHSWSGIKPCFELIQENIDKIVVHDNDGNFPFYELYVKNNLDKYIYSTNHRLLFECDKNSIVDYIAKPCVFKVTDSNGDIKLKLCQSQLGMKAICNDKNFKKFIDSTFLKFDVITNPEGKKIYDYTVKTSENSGKRNISRLDFYEGRINNILSGSFNINGFSEDLTRTIVFMYDEESSKVKFGVIENGMGRTIIPFDYSEITYCKDSNTFICKTNDEQYEFDEDGFEIVDPENQNENNHSEKTYHI